MSDILVTDSLFIGDDHVSELERAGHSVTRLDKPKATADELKAALAGMTGYILGGVESVTADVIEAAADLQVISFTGSAYAEFIPGWELATERGIAISAARGANASSVAEWALLSGLALVRNLVSLTTPGDSDFHISREAEALTLGIVGYGNIGRALRNKARALGLRVVVTESQVARDDLAETADLNVILSSADIVSVHVNQPRGEGAVDAAGIASLKPGAVLINASFERAIDNEALRGRLAAGDIRAAVDYPLVGREDLPVGAVLSSNAQTAFNTAQANTRVSDRTTQAMINLLATGFDRDLVNPAFRNNR